MMHDHSHMGHDHGGGGNSSPSFSNPSKQPNDSKISGSDMCLVENRDAETSTKVDKRTIATHVWETCRPNSNFMFKVPTVSAKKVQLMRYHLLNSRRIFDECEPVSQGSPDEESPACPRGGCPRAMGDDAEENPEDEEREEEDVNRY